MWKKILTISLAMVMVLSLAACVKEEEELASAQEIIDGVIASLDDIRTYQFDIDMTMDMTGEAEGDVVEMTMVMDGSGAADVENGKMNMDMVVRMMMMEMEMEMGMEMYVIGNTVYMLMDMTGTEATWMKAEMPEEYWEQINQVESQTAFLETAQVEVIGSERVGGIDCYVLQVTPDMDQLWQLFMQQAELTGGTVPDVDEEFLQEVFRSFSVKQWIAKDTYFLTKAEMDMVIELTPEAMGYPEEEGIMTTDIAMTFLGYDYNQPVSIGLPPEAEEAVEVTM